MKESKAIGWPDNSHRDWLDLLLLLATSTISSSLVLPTPIPSNLYCSVYNSGFDFLEAGYAPALSNFFNFVANENQS